MQRHVKHPWKLMGIIKDIGRLVRGLEVSIVHVKNLADRNADLLTKVGLERADSFVGFL